MSFLSKGFNFQDLHVAACLLYCEYNFDNNVKILCIAKITSFSFPWTPALAENTPQRIITKLCASDFYALLLVSIPKYPD